MTQRNTNTKTYRDAYSKGEVPFSTKEEAKDLARFLTRIVGSVALAGVAVAGIKGVSDAGHGIYNHYRDVQETGRIIDDPENIPAGHSIDITVDDSDTAVTLGQQFGSKGNIQHLQEEIQHQADKNGHLQPGQTVTVYTEWVDPIAFEKTQHE